jgi:uncharacterized DUF497 family protein
MLCGISWDEEKNCRNLELHGIAFEDAARIFEGPTVERVDDRFDYGERRVYAIGLVNGLEITVIYTDRKHDERRSSRPGAPSRMSGATTGETSRVMIESQRIKNEEIGPQTR